MDELVNDGERLVSRYMRAQEEVLTAKRELGRAETEAHNAEMELAKWLIPSDMKQGEKIAVWRGDSLFQVEMTPVESYSAGGDGEGKPVIRHEPRVTVRSRGKHFSELRR